jgi:hypothetical protein
LPARVEWPRTRNAAGWSYPSGRLDRDIGTQDRPETPACPERRSSPLLVDHFAGLQSDHGHRRQARCRTESSLPLRWDKLGTAAFASGSKSLTFLAMLFLRVVRDTLAIGRDLAYSEHLSTSAIAWGGSDRSERMRPDRSQGGSLASGRNHAARACIRSCTRSSCATQGFRRS